MANTRSAKKRILVGIKKQARNRAVKSAVKTRVVHARHAIENDGTAAPEELKEAIAALDRAAERGVLHGNNVARRKSRLQKRITY